MNALIDHSAKSRGIFSSAVVHDGEILALELDRVCLLDGSVKRCTSSEQYAMNGSFGESRRCFARLFTREMWYGGISRPDVVSLLNGILRQTNYRAGKYWEDVE